MADVDPKSEPITCAVLAIASGVLVSIGVNVIAVAVHRQTQDHERKSLNSPKFEEPLLTGGEGKPSKKFGVPPLAYAANIFFNLAGILAFIIATSKGPVSIVMPVETAAVLLSNLGTMWYYNIAPFDQTCLIGTLLMVSAATCLGEIGPPDATAGKDVSVPDLLSGFLTRVWFAFLVAFSVLCIVFLVRMKKKQGAKPDPEDQGGGEARPGASLFAFSFMVAAATSIGASVGKILTLTSGTERMCFSALYFVCGIGSLAGGAIAASKCDQSVYLPLNECMKLIINAVTGVLVWGDVSSAPTAYVMVYFQMCLAVSLCASMDKPKALHLTHTADFMNFEKIWQRRFASLHHDYAALERSVSGLLGSKWNGLCIVRLKDDVLEEDVHELFRLFDSAKDLILLDSTIGLGVFSYFGGRHRLHLGEDDEAGHGHSHKHDDPTTSIPACDPLSGVPDAHKNYEQGCSIYYRIRLKNQPSDEEMKHPLLARFLNQLYKVCDSTTMARIAFPSTD